VSQNSAPRGSGEVLAGEVRGKGRFGASSVLSG
jgi:hypothetical protein